MDRQIRLLSTDFDGTLVAHDTDPVLDARCMRLIQELQEDGVLWAINTGRSVQLLESGLLDFEFPVHPDYILTSERDIFRPSTNGGSRWEPYGDWNTRVARDHAELFASTSSVLNSVVEFVSRKTNARLIYTGNELEGLIAQNDEEMARILDFIDEARTPHPKFHYQRNSIYLRFCHADYHKGAALGELQRLVDIPREQTFAAGDHHNDVSMLDGRYAAMPACPANAVDEVKDAVRSADGYVAESCCGAGVYEALRWFCNGGL
ncbi:MAG TPA: HAD family hydrolase [Chthoniobacterales bacterium]|nr:HAD family hydrolase [Chthoniobacterales bacterium]